MDPNVESSYPYLKAVIKEVLRLRTSAPSLGRIMNADTDISWLGPDGETMNHHTLKKGNPSLSPPFYLDILHFPSILPKPPAPLVPFSSCCFACLIKVHLLLLVFTLTNLFVFSSGDNVMLNLWMNHHHPQSWSNPEEFNPNRFLLDSEKPSHPSSWLSFGAGPRICVGMRLAMKEITVTTIDLITKFNFILKDPNVGYHQDVTLRAAPGMFVTAVPI